MEKSIKIVSLDIAHLQNAQYYQFMENILRLFQKNKAILKADHLIEGLETGLGELFKSFKKEKTNSITEKILALDQKRDRLLRQITLFAKAYELGQENPTQKQAAQDILALIQLYGGGKIMGFDHNKETASLSNLLHDLEKKTKNALSLLQLDDYIASLKQANLDFKTIYHDRTDFMAEQTEVLLIAQIRKGMNHSYRVLCKWMDGLPASAGLNLLVAGLNAEITKFHALLPAKKKKEEA